MRANRLAGKVVFAGVVGCLHTAPAAAVRGDVERQEPRDVAVPLRGHHVRLPQHPRPASWSTTTDDEGR
jgi:hypothetical protein